MSNSTPTPEQMAGHLLELFKRDLKERLVKEVMAELAPKVDEACKAAVLELNSAVQTHFDIASNRTVVAILVDKNSREVLQSPDSVTIHPTK